MFSSERPRSSSLVVSTLDGCWFTNLSLPSEHGSFFSPLFSKESFLTRSHTDIVPVELSPTLESDTPSMEPRYKRPSRTTCGDLKG